MKFVLVMGRARFVGLLILVGGLLVGAAAVRILIPLLLGRGLTRPETLLTEAAMVTLIFLLDYIVAARLIAIRTAIEDEEIGEDLAST